MHQAGTNNQVKNPEIVYQDQDILVINKPSGLHSVRQPKSSASSLAEWLIQNFSELGAVGMTPGEGGLVQRLDKETSGLIIAAKNNNAWSYLREQLMQGNIEKEYYCLVEGALSTAHVTVQGFIGSPYRRAGKVRVYSRQPGKPHRALAAKTEFHQISSTGAFSLLKASAATARRHQIRAHASALGNPLVGDALYGSRSMIQSDYPGKFYLQAMHLSFQHPVNSQALSFNLDMPESIASLLR